MRRALLAIAIAMLTVAPAGAQEESRVLRGAQVHAAASHDQSPPLFLIPPARGPGRTVDHPPRRWRKPITSAIPDPVVQSSAPLLLMPSATVSFDGVGDGLAGPGGTFSVQFIPPDTDGDVGLNHYISLVNSGFAIWDKSGSATPIFGPVLTNTLFNGLLNSQCDATNDGDGVVLYDPLADRWFLTQFSVSNSDGTLGHEFEQCVAVSKTADPTGQWYRYTFKYSDFNDYGKFGVWPDGYYATYNMFNGNNFDGAGVCVFDRAKMLAGAAATEQCFGPTSLSSFGGLLPADMDGTTPPHAGEPNFVVGFGTNVLQLFKFHVDWTTPANSTFTGPANLTVPSFSEACSGGTCIPQPGTAQLLDSLADRMMFRFAYRNFGTYESLVVNHSVDVSGRSGLRWYEIRSPNGTPNVAQKSTYSPDTNYRWMGSIAQDRLGDMAVGYSISSSSMKPTVAWAGRLAGDTSSTLGQGEASLFTGAGVQTPGSCTPGASTPCNSRWGDYSSMAVDPSDDCTFWFTTEYIPANGAFNWHTRVANFKFSACVDDFSISATPTPQTVNAGSTAPVTVNTAVKGGGAPTTVALFVSDLPAGVTGSFNPASVAAGASSTLTLTAASGAALVNNVPYVITGTATSGSRSILPQPTVTVAAAVVNDFSISVNPSSQNLLRSSTTTYNVTTALLLGSAESVALSTSALPTGVTASFTPPSVSAGSGSTLTLTSSAAATLGTAPFTITGTATSKTHGIDASVTVQAPDFSVSVTPFSRNATPGGAGVTYSVQTAVVRGAAESVALSVTGLPANVTSGFSPSSTITAGGSSTLTVTAGAPAASGTTDFTITATAASATHSAPAEITIGNDFSLSVSAASGNLSWGSSATFTVSTAVTNGAAQAIALTAPSLPAGVTASFSPASLTAGQSSTLTLTASGTPAGGSAQFTVTGTATSGSHNAQGNVTVADDFSIAVSPATALIPAGGSVICTVSTNLTSGSAETVALTVSGLPTGVSGAFSSSSVLAGHNVTLTLSATLAAAIGASTFTVSGSASSASHMAGGGVTVTPDFSVSISPASQNVLSGQSATFTVTTATTAGPAQTIGFAVTGLPAGLTAQVSPASVMSGLAATVTITAAADSAGGSFPFSLSGTGTNWTHSALATAVVPSDFSLSLSPVTVSVPAGSNATVAIATARTSGTTQTISLSVSGAPAGLGVSLNPLTVTAGQSATLTIAAGSSMPATAASLTVTGSAGSVSHNGALAVETLSPPAVVVDLPAASATVSGSVTVQAHASVSAGTTLTGMELLVDGTSTGTSSTSPATFSWNSAPVANGTHSLVVKATDAAGETGSATVSVTSQNPHPPAVAFASPLAGATVSGSVDLTATASGQFGATVTGVAYTVDGAAVGAATQAPFTVHWDTTKVSNGARAVAAVATDSAGVSSAATSITVQVANNKGGCGGCSSSGGGWETLGFAGLLALARRRRKRG